MKTILTLLIMLLPAVAFAQEKTILVAENKYQWSIKVENCPINPEKPATILRKKPLPSQKVYVSQDGKVYRCDVKQIKVDVT